MKKRVTDLNAGELGAMAARAWHEATEEAFAKGLPVTGSRDGRRFRYYPDGRVEDLGPIQALPNEDIEARQNERIRKSVA